MIALHYGMVYGEQFVPEDSTKWKKDLGKLEGKQVVVTIKQYRRTRSNNQNRYAFGVVFKLIADATGYTVDEAKEAMKWMFLREEHDILPPTVRSTTELDTAEMEEFLENCRRWASEFLGLYIPLPNEVDL